MTNCEGVTVTDNNGLLDVTLNGDEKQVYITEDNREVTAARIDKHCPTCGTVYGSLERHDGRTVLVIGAVMVEWMPKSRCRACKGLLPPWSSTDKTLEELIERRVKSCK